MMLVLTSINHYKFKKEFIKLIIRKISLLHNEDPHGNCNTHSIIEFVQNKK